MSIKSDKVYENMVDKMMDYRGFERVSDGLYLSRVIDHTIPIFYINNADKIKDSMAEIRTAIDENISNYNHIIIVYTDSLSTPIRKLLLDSNNTYFLSTGDINHYELFTIEDISIPPVDTFFSSDELLIYPHRTDINNIKFDSLTRHVEFTNNDSFMAKLTLSDALVRYLNLMPGTIITSMHDRGYDNRVCPITYKNYIVVDDIRCKFETIDIVVYERSYCNCTNYNCL